MGRHYPEIQSAGAEVLVILGDSPERATRYATATHAPFPVLADPAEEVYHRFGLHRALGLIQRTASVIVDRDGIIRYLKRATNTFTWLHENRELFAVVAQLGHGEPQTSGASEPQTGSTSKNTARWKASWVRRWLSRSTRE